MQREREERLNTVGINENDDDPCVNKYNQGIGVYDKICDALIQNDLRDVVASADFNIDIWHLDVYSAATAALGLG